MARPRGKRRPRRMTEAEVDAYLDARREWAVLTTIGPDGSPHSVPLGYFRLGGELYLGVKEGTQKVRNLERNPRAAVLVTAAKDGGEVSGVLIQGEGALIRDSEERLRLAQAAARQRGVAETDLPKRVTADGVYVRVSRRRVRSWRYE